MRPPPRLIRCLAAAAMLPMLAAAPPTTRYVDNTDESKAGTYTLPDARVLTDGQPVRDARTWITQRRPHLLELFRTQVYGIAPPPPPASCESFDVFESSRHALHDTAVRKQVHVNIDVGYMNARHAGSPHIQIDTLLYTPAAATGPVPLFCCLSFTPLQTVVDDPDVRLMDLMEFRTSTFRPGKESDRGTSANRWPIAEILSRGYGIALIYYQQIEADSAGDHDVGVRASYRLPGQPAAPDSWGTIAAWAWGASRVMDYLQTDHDVDAHRIAILGHSRLGKTALWTGASDGRFAMVIAAQSGRGGAALARRNYGESIQRLTSRYGYQFDQNYVNWASHINDCPVDSHELIDLVAPRPFYQTASLDDKHSDPLGEFLAEVAAGPVYKLLGADGLDTNQMPPLNVPIMHTLGFHYRPGKHEVSAWDWDRFLDFADLQFRHIAPTTRLAP